MKTKPKEVKNPEDEESINKEQDEKFEKISDEIDVVQTKIDSNNAKLEKFNKELEELSQILADVNRLEQQISDFNKQNSDRFGEFGLDIKQIVKVEIDNSEIKKLIKTKETEKEKISQKLKSLEDIGIISDNSLRTDAEKNSLLYKINKLRKELKIIQNELSKPVQEYQEYKSKIKNWEIHKNKIIGDSEIRNSLKYFEGELDFLNNKLKSNLLEKRNERINISIEILNKKSYVIQSYYDLKTAIDKIIVQNKDLLAEYKINIVGTLKLKSNFRDNFFSFINQNRSGSFYGIESGKKILNKVFFDNNFSEPEDVKSALRNIIIYLEKDQRENIIEEERTRYIHEQVTEIHDFYHYLFSLNYLEPIYELKWDDKNLDELSPGEKGALLLVFYLMLDREEIPLIIDQPEDNLDNQSVFKILTNFIKRAKKRRQIIMVTHNPNLAVGADAEQIIYVDIEKKDKKNKFSFISGAIENSAINKKLVDILEGTMPAFNKRRLKYLQK